MITIEHVIRATCAHHGITPKSILRWNARYTAPRRQIMHLAREVAVADWKNIGVALKRHWGTCMRGASSLGTDEQTAADLRAILTSIAHDLWPSKRKHRSDLSEPEIRISVEMYLCSASISQIARALRRQEIRVRAALTKAGVEIIRPGRYQIGKGRTVRKPTTQNVATAEASILFRPIGKLPAGHKARAIDEAILRERALAERAEHLRAMRRAEEGIAA